MSEKKIIAVLGATGAQGGSLVRAILSDSDGDFTARAITRDINSDKSKDLVSSGVEVVQADLDNKDSLVEAFKGAYGVFGVTNFWEHFSPEKETEQARNIAEAAEEAGVMHVIWSSLDDTRKLSPLGDDSIPVLMDKYKVPHFDAKGEAEKFFNNSSVPSTVVRTVFYWDNFIYFGLGPKKDQNGNYAITFPMGDAKLPGIAAEDIGKSVYGIFRNPAEYKNKTIGIAGEHLTGKELADGLGKALNVDVSYNDVPPEVYRSFGFPGAEDMGNMFQFKRDFEKEYVDSRSVSETRKLNPDLQSFTDWLEKNKDRIPME